ncbi:MAG: epoxide hydrolase family protein [Pseudomonadota bacterium]
MYTKDNSSPDSEKITLHISQPVLDDLRYRLSHTRWPDEMAGAEWNYGTNRSYLKELVSYWADGFDWRAQEEWLNSFNHYKSNVNGLGIHYIHQRSHSTDAIPLLILHGWPGSFLQMLKLLPLLTDPAAHGMSDTTSFHVVIASLPGFGLSDASAKPGFAMEAIADVMATLMHDVLGYKKYGVRGSDLGGTTIDQMARRYPQQIIGAHLTQLIVAGPVTPTDNTTQAERDFLAACVLIGNTELSYARQHASKPQTLAYGLNDSPAGLAAWLVEKYHKWGDTAGNIESRFSKNFLLTTLTLYWATETIGSSIRTYYDMVRNRGNMNHIDVPTGFLMSKKDMFPPAPREWAERSHNVVHFSEAVTGGHFLEWEEPELVAKDMQVFFSKL